MPGGRSWWVNKVVESGTCIRLPESGTRIQLPGTGTRIRLAEPATCLGGVVDAPLARTP